MNGSVLRGAWQTLMSDEVGVYASFGTLQMKRPLAIHSVAKILDLPKKDLPTTASKEKPKLVGLAACARE